MTSMTRFILKIRLFLSTFFMRTKIREEKGFIYDLRGEEFKKLPMEEKGNMSNVITTNIWKKVNE